MYHRVLGSAVVAVFLGASSVLAQSVASVGGPAELPPSGFKGQQFVDSRGCVYLKAGLSGQVNWVLRVGRDRKPMCNQTPTFGPRPVIEVATAAEAAAPAMPAPVAQPSTNTVVMAKPVAVYATPSVAAALDVPAPTIRPRVRGGYETTNGGTGNRRIGCYTSAPVAEPVYADGAGVGASLSDPPVGFVAGRSGGNQGSGGHAGSGQTADAGADADAILVPKGYKLAWSDDRLNPKRGKGSAQGWAAQDQVWTRDVPAVAVVPTVPRVATSTSTTEQATKRKTVSTKTVGAAGRSFIQVGTFGVAANADGAVARLQALGLPVARAKLNKGGKALQIVLAGPFASAADAASVLSAVRGAGFGDAFVK